MHPKNISILDFTYHLPEERIARHPSIERGGSKLLIYQRGDITEDVYKNISQYLPDNSFLIFNDTKVIEARLLFRKATGGIIEIFCLEPHEKYPDITTAMLQQGKASWKCLIGGASKWKKGQMLEKKIEYGAGFLFLRASYVEKKDNEFVIEFSWDPKELSFAEVLHQAGLIPLPPYIKRDVEEKDAERYQTIYANLQGSVAAPTAGLHFTDNIFKKFAEKNITWGFVTLHVGAGTFQPVKAETMQHHHMHGEFIDISIEMIEKIIDHMDTAIIPVGTTSLRTIESLFWLGVKIILQPNIPKDALVINQWDVYELPAGNISAAQSLQALREWMLRNRTEKLITKTHLLVAPGYQFKITKGLITNFHQPQSTLLLLVAALIKDDWRNVYQYAIENNFLFLSYGDGCLFLI